MTKDEALKMALELIQDYVDEYGPHDKDSGAQYVVTAIKEALAEPEHGWTPERIAGIARLKDAQDKRLAQSEQEPVACDGDFPEGFDASLGVPAQALRAANAIMCDVIGKREWDVPCTAQHVLSFAKKYTTPPQRKPLTDEKINEFFQGMEPNNGFWLSFARAIEAAHGIIAPTELKGEV